MNEMQTQSQGNYPEAIRLFAKEYDLPVTGVTNMGGKPYVNAGGLMFKAKQIGLKKIKIQIDKAATKEDPTSIVKAIVTLKDNSEYEDYGYGSKESIKMSTLHNPDFITMTTITRAKNRALRSATGFGLVSVEEMVVADNMYSNDRGSVEVEGSKLAALKVPQESKAVEPVVAEEEVVEVKLGELKKKEEPESISSSPNSFYDDKPTQETIDAAEEVFGSVVHSTEAAVKTPPKLSIREKKDLELLNALEKNPAYDFDRALKAYNVTAHSDLNDSQLDICIQAVKKNKPF